MFASSWPLVSNRHVRQGGPSLRGPPFCKKIRMVGLEDSAHPTMLYDGPSGVDPDFRMIIFDAHLDLAWNAIDFNRDLRQRVADIRKSEAGMPGKSRGCNTVSFPELHRGGVVIFIATLLARLLRSGPNPAVQRYTSMEAAYAAACGQLGYYRAMEQTGWLRWIKDWPTLEAHLRAWQTTSEDGTPMKAS